MQFRLVYRGSLPSQRGGGKGGSLGRDKHNIRKQFHPQLRELWQQEKYLNYKLRYETLSDGETMRVAGTTDAEKIFTAFTEGPFKFLPLITKTNGLACKLDILFLRRDSPGNLVGNGGDIDNRIKVLFDALRIPDRGSMNDFSPDVGETPFFCLLEDDRLITEVSVVTDRLLIPMQDTEHIHDVLLVLHITVKVIDANAADFEFLGG